MVGGTPNTWSTWLMIPYDTGLTRCRPIFHVWSGIPRRTRRTRGRMRRNHKGKHSRTSPITHPLDNQTHKIHKVHEQQRKRYKVRFIFMRRSWIHEGIFSWGVLNPRWIFSEERPRSLLWSRSVMDEQSSISKWATTLPTLTRRGGVVYIV